LKSHPGHFTPEEKPWYPLLGSWVGPVASMDDLEKKKSFTPVTIQTLDHPACSIVTIPTMMPGSKQMCLDVLCRTEVVI